MNHWPFVIAAYLVVAAGTVGIIGWSWRGMRNAERAVDRLTQESAADQ